MKLIFWWALLAGAVAGVFVLSFVPAQMRVYDAYGDYEDARRMLDESNAWRSQMQMRLDALRTRVDSVELGARAEYRLIKPGEKLEILDVRPDKSSFAAHTRPGVELSQD